MEFTATVSWHNLQKANEAVSHTVVMIPNKRIARLINVTHPQPHAPAANVTPKGQIHTNCL